MKGCYFLVALSAVVYTVWSEPDCQDCKIINLQKCLDSIPDRAVRRMFFFSMNRKELNRWCTVLKQEMQCIDNYTERCRTEEEFSDFYSQWNSTIQFYKNVCHPGRYQEEFLLHAPCMRQVSDDYQHCFHHFERKMAEVQEKLDDQDGKSAKQKCVEYDSALRTECCSFHDYEDCFEVKVMKKCGEKAEKFIEDEFNQIYFNIDQDDCKDYPRGSDQCPGSSASRKRQLSLLLPISLAMLSLYALRST